MADKFWKKVSVDVQSVLGTAQTITAIQKTDPGVVTHDGASVTDGDYLLMDVSGMTELKNRVVRADNVGASPSEFELEELDCTAFGTFTSGTFQEVTFGTSLSTVTGITTSGGEPEFEDTSVIHDNIRTQAPTVVSPFTVSMESKWDPADTALQALFSASDAQAARAVRITFSDNSRIVFYAWVNCTLIPTGTFPGLVKCSITFTALGRNTALST
jgi:hypothetical protein